MNQKYEYNAPPQSYEQPGVHPMYRQQPPPPGDMQYVFNASNQQHSEKRNYALGSKWTFGFFDCCSLMNICCMGHWCPCILYGRTQARNAGDEDPSGCNLMCCAWYCLLQIGGHSILQAVTRNGMRKKNGIDGNCCTDWLGACCCPCCGLIQEEKESLLRETGIDPKTKQQYQAPQPMMA